MLHFRLYVLLLAEHNSLLRERLHVSELISGGRAYETLSFSTKNEVTTEQFFIIGIFQFMSGVSHIMMEVILFKIL